MRAVVDTNVLVSALLTPGGGPARLLGHLLAGRLRPVVCAAILAEYRHVLLRPRFRQDPAAMNDLVDTIGLVADWVPVPAYAGEPALPDPTDWPFIAAARIAGCVVVTGNLRHFPAGCGAQALSVSDALAQVAMG